jgi:signal transduction histidine kinase
VLNVSRIEAGALSFQFAAVDVRSLVAKVVSDFAVHSGARRITLRGAAELPPAWADRDRLEEVLTNLVDNAVKYSPAGGEIVVDVRRTTDLGAAGGPAGAEAGAYVVVSVIDQGAGIALPEQERLFERFYRVEKHDSREVYGHGLGLYIARRLIEAHHGHIWVESTPGKGASFSFAVPVAA